MKDKITSGVKLGDLITVRWEDDDNGKQRQQTGVVIDIDHNNKSSGEFAMFHLGNKRGQSFWYYGSDITIHPELMINNQNKLITDESCVMETGKISDLMSVKKECIKK